MAKKTEFDRDELVTRILELHLVIGEGQSATDGQRAKAEKVIDPATDELRERQIVDLDPDQPMPIKYKEHLASFCAWFCAPDFYKPRVQTDKTNAEIQIRRIRAKPYTREDLEINELFQGGTRRRDYDRYGPRRV